VSSFCDTLGATKIDIDGVDFILNHFRSLDHGLGIVATKLRNKGTIFFAGGKMLILISFVRGHHFGM